MANVAIEATKRTPTICGEVSSQMNAAPPAMASAAPTNNETPFRALLLF